MPILVTLLLTEALAGPPAPRPLQRECAGNPRHVALFPMAELWCRLEMTSPLAGIERRGFLYELYVERGWRGGTPWALEFRPGPKSGLDDTDFLAVDQARASDFRRLRAARWALQHGRFRDPRGGWLDPDWLAVAVPVIVNGQPLAARDEWDLAFAGTPWSLGPPSAERPPRPEPDGALLIVEADSAEFEYPVGDGSIRESASFSWRVVERPALSPAMLCLGNVFNSPVAQVGTGAVALGAVTWGIAGAAYVKGSADPTGERYTQRVHDYVRAAQWTGIGLAALGFGTVGVAAVFDNPLSTYRRGPSAERSGRCF